MRPYFRPFAGPTIAYLVMLAILLGLGFWQLQRLQWKLGLIAEANRHLTAPPITLGAALALGPAAEYRRVEIEGLFDNTREAYVFSTGPDGAAAYHVITPLSTRERATILVDRGIVPADRLDPASRSAGEPQGTVRIVGVWRTPDRPNAFTPAPDLARHIWYARDLGGIARALGVKPAAQVLVEADATPNPGGWPRGGQTVVVFRNDHLQYAITWFALAAALSGVYIAYHISRGRLGLRR